MQLVYENIVHTDTELKTDPLGLYVLAIFHLWRYAFIYLFETDN